MSPGNRSKSISWMAKNPVAANLLMITLLLGGVIIIFTQIKQEIFPPFEIDKVTISVPYPGASPDEVEKGIILAIEEAIQGIEGIEKISSTAKEGGGIVVVDVLTGADRDKVASDIKNEIDRISSFPLDAEEPEVAPVSRRREVLDIVLYGDADEKILHSLAETVREDLLRDDKITLVELDGILPVEISIEVAQSNLRAHGLTIEGIASEIKKTAVELPGGGIKTKGGEILLRTTERRELGKEFANLTMISRSDGTTVRLGDLATIKDGYEDKDTASYFNGKRAVMVEIFRIGDQKPLDVARAAKGYIKALQNKLPPGIEATIWHDRSDYYHQRINLLKKNAAVGLVLVLFILGLFLEIRLAFWVTMGIPISFLGSFIVLNFMDVSINMISLFAFIITLGMVVDDAIIIGESIYVKRERASDLIGAAIDGASEMSVPVVFAILTTIAAFSPMFFVPGIYGKLFRIIPAVLIPVLLLSLLESLYILPAHLGHLKRSENKGKWFKLFEFQQRFANFFNRFIENRYGPVVNWVAKNRWITTAIGVAILLIAIGVVKGGRISLEFRPRIESDRVIAHAVLPYGVSLEETVKLKKLLEKNALQAVDNRTGGMRSKLLKGMYTTIKGSHELSVQVRLVPSGERDITAMQFGREWRKAIGPVAGIESLQIDSRSHGPRGGAPISVQLSHTDMSVLEKAASRLAGDLESYNGVTDIDDGFSKGKTQLNFRIKPEAQSLGITASELGRQMRSNFWGAEALRQQRGRNTVRVVVRLPKEERESEYYLEELLLRAPGGGEIPLFQAATMERGQSYTSIKRTDGKRTVHVTAEVDFKETTDTQVMESLLKKEVPGLLSRYPGLSYSLEGGNRERKESLTALFQGFYIALLVMYVLIAIPFKRYLQPMVVLSAIPFGFVGALLGHLIMGFNLSIISLMGLLALSGVVVNDSLVLVHTANKYAEGGNPPIEAVVKAGIRRFRPIILTSLTTFLGLTPMIFETSRQARFLIPMAISLGFGVLFATFIILLMVPAFYVILEDLLELIRELPGDAGKIRDLIYSRLTRS